MNDARAAIIEALMKQANPSVDPAARSWQERLMNWWQEGAAAPQPQKYDPRYYPPSPGIVPLGKR